MRIIVRYGGRIWGMEGGRHLLLRFLFIVSAALMAFVFAVIFVLDSFLIKGNSMEPTLRSGQRVSRTMIFRARSCLLSGCQDSGNRRLAMCWCSTIRMLEVRIQ